MIAGLVILVIVVLLIAADAFVPPSDREDEHSVSWHRANGQWRVRYPDGKISQPFSRKVAEDYAEIFGGEVIPK